MEDDVAAALSRSLQPEPRCFWRRLVVRHKQMHKVNLVQQMYTEATAVLLCHHMCTAGYKALRTTMVNMHVVC